MGPRSRDRGNARSPRHRYPRRFNGAAIPGSRKCARRRGTERWTSSLLQWGRDPGIAEMTREAEHRTTPGIGLQWGRDPGIAEICRESLTSLARGMLQWGRDPGIAEIVGEHHQHTARWKRFNGAAIPGSRKS